MLPEYRFFCYTEFPELLSGTRYHSRRSTEIVFFIVSDIFRSYPVGHISLMRFWIFWTRDVLDVFEILKSPSDFLDLLLIEGVLLFSYSEDKRYHTAISQNILTRLHLTKYWSKSRTGTDEALTPWSIVKDKMSKRNESRE